MEQTYLGRSGLVVSELCLGTMTFADPAELATSRQIVERFREAGGTFFDVADIYNAGRSEEVLGEILDAWFEGEPSRDADDVENVRHLDAI